MKNMIEYEDKGEVDILITDVFMPGINGWELCQMATHNLLRKVK